MGRFFRFKGGDKIRFIKSCIPWVGGKARIIRVINKLLPKKAVQFIDVFGGSATVTLNTYPSPKCVHIYNDFNGDLVNLFHCVRERPLALVEELGFLPLNSRDEFAVLLKAMKKEPFDAEYMKKEMELTEKYFDPPNQEVLKELFVKQAELGDVKRAASFFKVLRYSFNANGKTFGAKPCDIRRFFGDIWACSRRLAKAIIEHKDFEAIIVQYGTEGNVVYCDPPYYEAEGFYAVIFTAQDHQRLHDVLLGSDAFVMVSYNDCDFIQELYKEFYIFRTTRPNSMSHKKDDEYGELIITNYFPPDFSKVCRQTSMFDEGGDEFEFELELLHEPEDKKYIKETK